jgi:hypothetical protein
MGLSNASKRARFYSQTITRNQGGGNKKAGLPFMVGRTAWDSIYMMNNNVTQHCCGLQILKVTANPNVKQSRSIGSGVTMSYWRNGANY